MGCVCMVYVWCVCGVCMVCVVHSPIYSYSYLLCVYTLTYIIDPPYLLTDPNLPYPKVGTLSQHGLQDFKSLATGKKYLFIILMYTCGIWTEFRR